jgi:hypothetical protein
VRYRIWICLDFFWTGEIPIPIHLNGNTLGERFARSQCETGFEPRPVGTTTSSHTTWAIAKHCSVSATSRNRYDDSRSPWRRPRLQDVHGSGVPFTRTADFDEYNIERIQLTQKFIKATSPKTQWWCLIGMELLERRCRLEWMIGATVCRTFIITKRKKSFIIFFLFFLEWSISSNLWNT